MTLCIAALCTGEKGSCVVFASDKRIETNISGGDIGLKIRTLPNGWMALAAGPVAQSDELLDLYDAYLLDQEITSDTAIEQLRIPARTLRKRLADSLTYRRVAMSHKNFLEHQKGGLTHDPYNQLAYEISQQQIESELILVGIIRDRFRLFLCRDGDIYSVSEFAVIGSGAGVAEPILYQRGLNSISNLKKALYVVYEAKKLGEAAPGVGRETIMGVRFLNKGEHGDEWDWHFVSIEGRSQLDRKFKQYGPRPVKDIDIRLETILPSMFEECEPNEKTDDSSATESAGQEAEDGV
jgi:20S proteasome alpha/beta subunit